MISSDAYAPWKSCDPDLKDDEFVSHPSEVCEPVNLAGTEGPLLEYTLSSKPTGLSTLQTETIRAIMSSLAQRSAFLLGDATGVGKGRTLAGLTVEYTLTTEGRVLWVSANSRLEAESTRELTTVGASIDAVAFGTYSALLNPARASALIGWLQQGGGAPLVILDECHLLRNTGSIALGAIETMLAAFPEPSVVYSSATPCSQARHLHYLGRIGLFGTPESPFASYSTLRAELCAHGSAYMELLAMDMKARGAYVARQLSFHDIEVKNHVCSLDTNGRRVYDRCVAAVRNVGRTGSQQQRFFQKLITALKVSAAIQIAESEVAAGHSVVISLINTGEAAARRRTRTTSCLPGFEDADDILEHLSDIDVPPNPMDALVSHFGTDRVVELSGRRMRPVRQADGSFTTSPVPNLAMEADDFVSGRKHVAIVTRAGGTGISLHDKRDGRRRVHMILELPWSPEELLQQMGRTHRSDSIRAPRYILLTTDVPSELRFASSIVQKLQTFGALVKGDRTSCNLGFARVPQWSPSDKRSIGLCVAASTLQTGPLPVCNSRRAAQLVCGVALKSNEAAAKSSVIQALQLCDDAHSAEVLAGALRLYPQDLTILVESWSTTRHRLFPHPFQKQVVTLLLCAAAWETRQTLGMLPKDILGIIIEHLAGAVDKRRIATASSALREVGVKNVATTPTHQLLNHLLCIPLDLQDAFFALADMVSSSPKSTVSQKEKASAGLVQRYAAYRAGPCICADVDTVTHCSFAGGATGVTVTVRFTTQPPPAPPPDAQFFRHTKGSGSAWMRDTTVVFDDGRSVCVDDASVLREREFVPSTRREWEGAVYHKQAMATRRIKRQPRHFQLVTRQLLASWSSSQKRVLRLDPSPQFPHGLVGLLMSISS